MNKPHHGWIGVDLDGTLAYYAKWAPDAGIGDPIPSMSARVRHWLSLGLDVRVVTARVDHTRSVAERQEQERQVQLWCVEHLGRALPVQSHKDHSMWALFDDRAVNVGRNTGLVDRDVLEKLEIPDVADVAPADFQS